MTLQDGKCTSEERRGWLLLLDRRYGGRSQDELSDL